MRWIQAILLTAPLMAQVPTVTNGVSLNGLSCTWTGSSATGTSCTVSTSAISQVLSGLVPNYPGDEGILIGSDAVIRFIQSVNIGSSSITLTTIPPVGDSGGTIVKIVDDLNHGNLRVFATNSGTACYPAVAFGTSSGTYPYRTYQGPFQSTLDWIGVGGLTPSTTYFFQAQCNPTSGSATNQGVGTEFSVTTPAVPAGNHPTLPQAVPATWDPGQINITSPAYTIFPVPAFPDGTVTGTIFNNTSLLTVSNGAGFAANHWIRIAGVSCNPANGLTLPNQPDCQIASVSGNNIALNTSVVGTAINAAVTWSIYTVSDFLHLSNSYHVSYGTIFRWAQGYMPTWVTQNWGFGEFGILLDAFPPATWSTCALFPSPCSIKDPNHPYIIFETAPTPGFLPPSATVGNGNFEPDPTSGASYLVNYGGLVIPVGNSNGGDAFSLNATGSIPPHHFAIRRLKVTESSTMGGAGTSTDPTPSGGVIGASNQTNTSVNYPEYIVVDGVILQPPNNLVRFDNQVIQMYGGPWAVENNWIEGYYWRPAQPLSNQCSLGSGTVVIAKSQWKANTADNSYNMPGTATYTFTGSGGYAGAFWGQLNSSGTIDAYYTNAATGGGSISASCAGSGCGTLTANTNIDLTQHAAVWIPAEVPVCSASVSNSTTSALNLFGDSTFATEGVSALMFSSGPGPALIRNNNLRSVGDTVFSDVGPVEAYPNNPMVQDLTMINNRVIWPASKYFNGPSSDGYLYRGRQGIEQKQCRRCVFQGNYINGVFASVTQGAAQITSGRLSSMACATGANGAESLQGIADINIGFNYLNNNSADIYIQGGNGGAPGAACGSFSSTQLVADPPLSRNVYVHDNLMFPFSSGAQVSPPSQLFGEAFRVFFAPNDDTLQHNFAFGVGSPVQNPLEQFTDYVASEGWDMSRNVLEAVTGVQGNGAFQLDSSLQVSGYSYLPAMTTTNYLTQIQSAFPRLGVTITSATSMFGNVHILGDPYTQTDVNNYKNPTGTLFNSFATGNYFPNGATQALRVAASGYPGIASGDGRCVPNANNSCEAGANLAVMESALGLIVNVQAIASDTAVQITYTAPDLQACSVGLLPYSSTASDSGGPRNRTMILTGLTPSTSYNGQVFGYSSQTWLTFPSEPLSINTLFSFTTLASGTRTLSQSFSFPPGANSVVMAATPISGSGTVTVTCTTSPCVVAALNVGPVNIVENFWSNSSGGGTNIATQTVQVQ